MSPIFNQVLSRPKKYSVTVWGHSTSLTLEPIFWSRLRELATERGKSVQKLVEAIDSARVTLKDPPNLSTSVRTWILLECMSTSPKAEDLES